MTPNKGMELTGKSDTPFAREEQRARRFCLQLIPGVIPFQIMTIELIEILAVIGAVTGVAGTILSFFALLQDRGKLELSAFIGKIFSSSTPDIERLPNYLCLSVTNIGRRPLVISGIHGLIRWHIRKSRRSHALLVVTEIANLELSEGQIAKEQLLFTKKLKKGLLDYRKLWVEDSRGNRYKLSRRRLRDLQRLARTTQTASLVQDRTGQPNPTLDKDQENLA